MAADTPDFKDVLRVLLDKAAKWYTIGLHLDLSPGELDTIKADCSGAEECLTKAIRKWHSNANPRPTWRALIDALKTHAVSESVLAGQLEGRYFPKVSPEIVPTIESTECKASVEVARQGLTKIKQSFASLLKNVAVKFKSKQELDLEVFRFFIVNLFPPGECIPQSSNVVTIFEAVSRNGLWSYWHYTPVEKIVKEYAPEDDEMKGWLVSYKRELCGYKATTKIADAIEVYGNNIEEFEEGDRSKSLVLSHDPNYLRKLSVKLKTPVTEKTLEYVDDLWLSLAEYFLLPALSALLHNIQSGCIEVSWLIPPHYVFQIVGNLQENASFLQAKNIIQVFVDDECVYNRAQEDELKQRFFNAVSEGNTDETLLLLMSGIDVNTTFEDGWTALMIASRAGNLQVVEVLLAYGADIEMAEFLFGWTVVMIACKYGHLTLVRALVEWQANICAKTKYHQTCLMIACQWGHLDIVEFLLTLPSVDINVKDKAGVTALMHACRTEKVDILPALLNHPGVDINERSNGYGGATALMFACSRESIKCVELLLKYHADVNIRNTHGWTAMTYACFGGNTETVKLVLSHGGDPNVQDENGSTPLMTACCKNLPNIVQELIQGGANPNIKNKIRRINEERERFEDDSCPPLIRVEDGQTALSIARDCEYTDVVNLLKDCTTVEGGVSDTSVAHTDSVSRSREHHTVVQHEHRAMLENRRIFREILEHQGEDQDPPKAPYHPSSSPWQHQDQSPK